MYGLLTVAILFLGTLTEINGQKNTCTKGNETWSDTGNNACQNTCAYPNVGLFCKPYPTPGCICIEGYFRDSFGNCVLPADCDACGGDERKEFNSCGNTCPITCANKDTPRECLESCQFGGGCVCKPEYVEDINGNCILPSECPDCGRNAHYDCGSACDTECTSIGQDCPIKNIKCVERCYCNDGFARNQKGYCIPISKCPAKPTCPRNEVYDPCPPGCPPEQSCEDYLLQIVYTCLAIESPCNPKCVCKSGFVRKADGSCVLPKNCCNDPNEKVVTCPNPCPGGNCKSPDFANCKAACKISGCQCKKGYVKNDQGKCIHLSDCPAISSST